jgi:carbon monoxide dehydrogenase subunit G
MRVAFKALVAVAALTVVTTELTTAFSEAWAHGPTRRKVQEHVEINAAPAKVWAVIGNFQDMGWLAPVAKTEGEKGNEIGATRRLTLKDGATIEEELYKYDAEKMSYSYRINAVDVKVLPVTNYSSTITVQAGADGKGSVVEWTGAFYRGFPNNEPPPELSDEAAVKAVTDLYHGGLDGLKTKIESGS